MYDGLGPSYSIPLQTRLKVYLNEASSPALSAELSGSIRYDDLLTQTIE